MWQSLKEHRALAVVLLLVSGVAGVTAVTYRPEGVAPQSTAAIQTSKPAGVKAASGVEPKTVETDPAEPVIADAPAPVEQAPGVAAPLAQDAEPENTAPEETVIAAAPVLNEPVSPTPEVTPPFAEPDTQDVPLETTAAAPAAEPTPVPESQAQVEAVPTVAAVPVEKAPELELRATEAETARVPASAPQAQEVAAMAPAQPPSDIEETTPKALQVPQVQAQAVPATQSPTEGALAAPVVVEDRYKPRFDLVRVEPDGSAVVAGKAPAGAVVTILSDGIELGQATATSRGEFVAFVSTVPSKEVQTLELKAQVVGGPTVVSDDTVLLLAKTETNDLSLPELEATPQIPTVVKATSEGVSVVQSPDLAVLDEVSLDTIGYDAEGEVVLTGRGTPGQRVFIYADGKPVGANAISDRGSWRMVMVDLNAGRYLLRVDEVDPEGKVLSRVESPFQRVFPEDELKTAGLTRSNVVVQPGSNLWTIARIRYGSGVKYTQIYQANRDRIRDPDLIYPGQIFDLPETE